MKSEDHIRMMLKRWMAIKNMAIKKDNHQKHLEAASVTRTLKIILEEN